MSEVNSWPYTSYKNAKKETIKLLKLELWYTVVKIFLFFPANTVNDIEVNITSDNGGSLMVDTGEKHNLKTDWWETERFALPGDTKVVTIKGDNGPGSPGGILASFSHGVVTDGTWQCADMSSCTTTDCENSVTWQGAKTYGINGENPLPWNRKLNDIDSTAQWIWVDNSSAERVWCKKAFGKSRLLVS